MMDHQIKTMIVNAIMKVVDSAPRQLNIQSSQKRVGLHYSPFTSYQFTNPYQSEMLYQTDNYKEHFDVWINYVWSILKTASSHIDSNLYISVQMQIQSILTQPNIDYASKTTAICKTLLDLASRILYL